MEPSALPRRGTGRRAFLTGAAAGLAAGLASAYYAPRGLRFLAPEGVPSFSGRSREVAEGSAARMPGPFPGRVVEVRHPDAVRADHSVNGDAVAAMVDRGMVGLTGADHPHEAWARFFAKDDVVGIKVNPVGHKSKSSDGPSPAVGCISSPELLIKVVSSLKALGLKPNQIIVFERYANEFCEAGYDRVLTERSMDGVRWLASATGYGNQLDVDGFDNGRASVSPELGSHVVGYDPDVFVSMGFALPDDAPAGTDRHDDRRFRSHLSVIVTRLVNKIITLPVLKDHRSAGVTLALKNMSHGMNNNVARSHVSGVRREMIAASEQGALESVRAGDGTAYANHFARQLLAESGPNQCNTFIPTAVAQRPLREKATLHILDGLIGVYEGGPGNWNRTWGTWRRQSLFFATDPVALDHVGWDVLDAKRAEEGWPPVANMGLLTHTPAWKLSTGLAALARTNPVGAAAAAAVAENRLGGSATEVFDRRTPEHIILAEALGMGIFDARAIEHRLIRL